MRLKYKDMASMKRIKVFKASTLDTQIFSKKSQSFFIVWNLYLTFNSLSVDLGQIIFLSIGKPFYNLRGGEA